MKKFIITFLFAGSFTFSIAQNNRLDSLMNLLSKTVKPAERFNILVKILEYQDSYEVLTIDSSACATLLKIGQDQKSEAMLATAYNWIGYYLFFVKGDNIAALEYYFKAMPLAEKLNDKRRISSLCFDIGNIYNIMQNQNEVLKYTRVGGNNLPDKSSPMFDYMLVQYQRNMTRYYSDNRQLDSALYYVKAFTETSYRLGLLNFKYQAMIQNGYIHAQTGENELAETFFKKAMEIGVSIDANTRSAPFYKVYIPFLISNNRIDDAKLQTQQMWGISQRNKNPNYKLVATGLKRELFERLNQMDSAYFYSRLEANARELIFSQNNQNIIQAIAFKDQLRGIEEEGRRATYKSQFRQYILLGGLGIFTIIALLLYRNNLSRKKANGLLLLQKSEIEMQKRNVENALANLKSTQSQLIQSEKMASLGELTAGIAHEIQNPLNFVNNFSELNKELVSEIQDIRRKTQENRDEVLEEEILRDIKTNSEKINHHGKRAADIVKGMLQHSRSSSGVKEPTDINVLCDEYLRLSYHGLRAKDKSFNAEMKTDFDASLPKVNLIPQDVGRVVLNLLTNAFYAVNEKSKMNLSGYEPTVTVSTIHSLSSGEGRGEVLIRVSDNGNGIPEKVLDKIFQPFFTTKPTGQGTGLGLSLSYDIVKSHGGELKVETKPARPGTDGEGEGTTFTIQLPLQ